jgi:hypothetical protein
LTYSQVFARTVAPGMVELQKTRSRGARQSRGILADTFRLGAAGGSLWCGLSDRCKLAAAARLSLEGRVMADILEPGSELSLTVRGYEVIVRTAPDGALYITCPDLPQLSVSSPTVTEAISRTEDGINPL